MATTYFADNYNVPMPTYPGVGVALIREFTFTMAAAFVINDLVRLCKFPATGAPMALDSYYLDVPDLDTATGAALSIGDEDTPGQFVAIQTAVGQAPGKLSLPVNGLVGSLPVQYSAARHLQLKITTAPTTGTTTGVIKGWCMYHFLGAPSALPSRP